MIRGNFEIIENAQGGMVSLQYKEDETNMNWVQGGNVWGTVKCPEGIEGTITRRILPNGHLEERYEFRNISEFPVFFQSVDVGIYATFNDNYEEAEICMEERCHTHIFCGGASSYVMALRMGGRPPHLGLMVTEGGLEGYSVEREENDLSNDRGDFILHPSVPALRPGERAEIAWELFWFEDREAFERALIDGGKALVMRTGQCTCFIGENIVFDVLCKGSAEFSEIQVLSNYQAVSFTSRQDGGVTCIHCEIPVEQEGEYNVTVRVGKRQIEAVFYGCVDFRTLVDNRCGFIAEKQQYRGKIASLNGAYLIYDNEDHKIFYSHLDDHNGGRERIGMGALMALWLQKKEDVRMRESLERYVEYVYRELYDKTTGIVYNDISRNRDWHRLYNYPWVAVLQMEMYRLSGKQPYLEDAYRTMKRYYIEGGEKFYAIGIPMRELVNILEIKGMHEEAEDLKNCFFKHADYILEKGTAYPPFEVNYEQSIVAPAVSCLLQAYQLSGRKEYLEEAQKQLKILYLFNGRQPDYHQFENAIRHWDGYWFGKRRMLGDTYPHYWSVLTGVAFIQYAEITKDRACNELAKASFRGCLNLFSKNGEASCAMLFPDTVNGRKAYYYDPWANDQDWALYYALKYENVVVK